MCEPFTARVSFLSQAYLALLNDVRAKPLEFDAESPGRFEVLAAILSPHLVVILALLSRHDRAAFLTLKVERWGASKTSVARVRQPCHSVGAQGVWQGEGRRAETRGAESERGGRQGSRGWGRDRVERGELLVRGSVRGGVGRGKATDRAHRLLLWTWGS